VNPAGIATTSGNDSRNRFEMAERLRAHRSVLPSSFRLLVAVTACTSRSGIDCGSGLK
jgi:hypothetical protein